jgi:AcrR family transcriptional regulator
MTAGTVVRVNGGDSRRRRAERTREAILLAAAEVFLDQGYTGASLSDITARLGMTKGALYFHFASKEALAQAVVDAFYGLGPELIAEARARRAGSLAVAIDSTLTLAARFQGDPLVRGGARLAREGRQTGLRTQAPYLPWENTLVPLLEESRREGDLAADVDVAALARVVTAAFVGAELMTQLLPETLDLPSRIRELWRLLLPSAVTPARRDAVLAELRLS